MTSIIGGEAPDNIILLVLISLHQHEDLKKYIFVVFKTNLDHTFVDRIY
jgi:hypothetical protein